MSSTTKNQPMKLNPLEFDKDLLKTANQIAKTCAAFAKAVSMNPEQMQRIKLLIIGIEKVKHLDPDIQDRFFGFFGNKPLDVVAPIFRDYATKTPEQITALICQLVPSPEKAKYSRKEALWDLAMKFATVLTIYESCSNLYGGLKDALFPNESSVQVQMQIEQLEPSTKETATSLHTLGKLSLEELDEIENQILQASPDD